MMDKVFVPATSKRLLITKTSGHRFQLYVSTTKIFMWPRKELISVDNLTTHFYKVFYYAENCNCILEPYKNGALFSDQEQ